MRLTNQQKLAYLIKKPVARSFTSSQIFSAFCWLFLIAMFLTPDGMGVRIFFMINAKRVMLFACYFMILFNSQRLNRFWQMLKKCTLINIVFILYMIVRTYTAILRVDIKTFTEELMNTVMIFYLLLYILKYEISVSKFLQFVKYCTILLLVLGCVEFMVGINVFSYMNIANEMGVASGFRLGNTRICGNCHHPIGYGIFVSILCFLSCYNYEKKKLYLFNNPLIFILSILNVFFTGARGPLGLFFFGIFLIIIFSKKDEVIKSIIFMGLILLILTFFVVLFYGSGFSDYVLRMVTSAIDGIFGTTLSYPYGGQRFIMSTEYRKVLGEIFHLDWFNPILGHGESYSVNIWIAPFYINSIDNAYISMYVVLGYPGMIVFILLNLLMLGYAIVGAVKFKEHRRLFLCSLVILVVFLINIYYVEISGLYMYVLAIFAMMCAIFQNKKEEKQLKENDDGR